MCYLSKFFDFVQQVKIVTISDEIDFSDWDMVYYSNFTLYSKLKCPDTKIKLASITSHKCLLDKSKTLRELKIFDGVSVNNNLLLKEFSGQKFFYTPNGVDTSLFSFCEKPLSLPIIFGWVGNIDRAAKNYDIIKRLTEATADFPL